MPPYANNWGNGYYAPQIQYPQQMQQQQPMMNQNQQFQQQNTQQQAPSLLPRIVDKPEDIAPNEVPQDGRIYLFPLQDYSQIIAKVWDSNAMLHTYVFVQERREEPKTDADTMKEVMQRLDNIEKLVKKSAYRRPNKNKGGSQNG